MGKDGISITGVWALIVVFYAIIGFNEVVQGILKSVIRILEIIIFKGGA